MRSLAIVLFLTVAASAQSSVGEHATAGDFDDLFEAAPQCKQAVLLMTGYGPEHYSDKVHPVLDSCQKEFHDARSRVLGNAKSIKVPTKEQKAAIASWRLNSSASNIFFC